MNNKDFITELAQRMGYSVDERIVLLRQWAIIFRMMTQC